MKNSRCKKRLRIFRITGMISIIVGIVILLNQRPSLQRPSEIFQADIITIGELKENVVITQNVPIPEDLKIKMEEERKAKEEEEKRIAEEKAKAEEQARIEAEQKAKKEEEERKKQEELKLAQSKVKVTSRGGMTSREVSTKSTGTKSEYQAYAKDLCVNSYGWSENDYNCLVKLWERESNWNANSHNSSSGAHGIPQALPASKMASEGSDYYTNGKTQIRWGLKYIKNRYSNPTNAWKHSQQKGWY